MSWPRVEHEAGVPTYIGAMGELASREPIVTLRCRIWIATSFGTLTLIKLETGMAGSFTATILDSTHWWLARTQLEREVARQVVPPPSASRYHGLCIALHLLDNCSLSTEGRKCSTNTTPAHPLLPTQAILGRVVRFTVDVPKRTIRKIQCASTSMPPPCFA